jgi:hypothetical protein
LTPLQFARDIWMECVVLGVYKSGSGRSFARASAACSEEKVKHLQSLFGGKVYPYKRNARYEPNWNNSPDNQLDPETGEFRGYQRSERNAWTWQLTGLPNIKAAIEEVYSLLGWWQRAKADDFLWETRNFTIRRTRK